MQHRCRRRRPNATGIGHDAAPAQCGADEAVVARRAALRGALGGAVDRVAYEHAVIAFVGAVVAGLQPLFRHFIGDVVARDEGLVDDLEIAMLVDVTQVELILHTLKVRVREKRRVRRW